MADVGHTLLERDIARIVRTVLAHELEQRDRGFMRRGRGAVRGGGGANKPRWSLARNIDPLAVPPYGIVKITDTEEDGDGIRRFVVEQPDGSGPYAIANRQGMPNNSEHGLGGVTFDEPIEAAFDDAETPAVGDEWGPATNSFLLTKGGSGYDVLSTEITDPDGGNKRVLVKERGAGVVFPITLLKTGGSQGTLTTAASWTYTVTHALSGEELGTVVNPTAAPHTYNRPTLGQLSQADAGYAHYDGADLVIGYINERPGPGACA